MITNSAARDTKNVATPQAVDNKTSGNPTKISNVSKSALSHPLFVAKRAPHDAQTVGASLEAKNLAHTVIVGCRHTGHRAFGNEFIRRRGRHRVAEHDLVLDH
jgi:hypothetical protein